MINYSIYTADFVFAEEEDYPDYKTICVDQGLKLVLESTDKDDEYKIVQVISSDPQKYLRPQYSPGNIVKTKLQLEPY